MRSQVKREHPQAQHNDPAFVCAGEASTGVSWADAGKVELGNPLISKLPSPFTTVLVGAATMSASAAHVAN